MRAGEYTDVFGRPKRKRKLPPTLGYVGSQGECLEPVTDESSSDNWFDHGVRVEDQPSYQEWLTERAGYAIYALHVSIEINPRKRGGVPVLSGTRFTVAQLFAEIADGRSVPQLCRSFDLDKALVTQLFQGFAISFDRPFDASYDYFSPRRMLE